MVTRNHFVIPATVLEKFRSRGFPQGVTLTADHCIWDIPLCKTASRDSHKFTPTFATTRESHYSAHRICMLKGIWKSQTFIWNARAKLLQTERGNSRYNATKKARFSPSLYIRLFQITFTYSDSHLKSILNTSKLKIEMQIEMKGAFFWVFNS